MLCERLLLLQHLPELRLLPLRRDWPVEPHFRIAAGTLRPWSWPAIVLDVVVLLLLLLVLRGELDKAVEERLQLLLLGGRWAARELPLAAAPPWTGGADHRERPRLPQRDSAAAPTAALVHKYGHTRARAQPQLPASLPLPLPLPVVVL